MSIANERGGRLVHPIAVQNIFFLEQGLTEEARAIFDQSSISPTPAMVGVGKIASPLVSL